MATFFDQFRAQYPQAGMVAELISIYSDRFIVRVAVVQSGQVLASTLASDTRVETAEDKARDRLLALLGFGSGQPSNIGPNTPLETATVAQTAPSNGHTKTVTPEIASTETVQAQGHPEAESSPVVAPIAASNGGDEDDFGPPIDAISEEPLADEPIPSDESNSPEATSLPRSSAATIALENFNASASRVDLSDVIAQTDVELMRLGWSNEQGREHLQKTYGKRSRQQLTDEELMSFLLFLEEQTG